MDTIIAVNKGLKRSFQKKGYVVIDQCMMPSLSDLLPTVQMLAEHHSLPLIERNFPGRSLKYRVMDGGFIESELPQLSVLGIQINQFINALTGENLSSLKNRTAAINVNITEAGGQYRWHYDRNAITAILYLNAVEGGETQLLPNSRWHLGPFKATALQRMLDSYQIKRVVNKPSCADSISPKPARLLVMRGDRCLHSVSPVTSSEARYNIIFTFDQQGAEYAVDKRLDPYIYSIRPQSGTDPNYIA